MLRALRTGRLVEVDEKGKATFLTCPWLIEVARVITEEMAEAGWYPDFPSDLVEIIECRGRMYADLPDGQRCEHGHEFGNMERRLGPWGTEWQREREEAGVQ